MRYIKPSDLIEGELDVELDAARRRGSLHRLSHAERRPKQDSDHVVNDEILAHAHHDCSYLGAESVFRPTFTGSRYEREWILDYLGRFYDDKQITDVLGRVKGGKEANVYCCAAHPATGLELIAAKVYRPRAFRQLRNDARYRQGRELLDERGKTVRDGGLLHAVRKKTGIGKEAEHVSWVEYEYQALVALWQAGADVPRPISHGNSTILMEYLGQVDAPAPTLHAVTLEPGEVRPIYARLLRNLELMLAQGRIHGDLSAFNVLYWDGQVKLIDFPQVVDTRSNREAFDIFQRDVLRLCQYFRRYGVAADAGQIAAQLWARYGPPAERPWPAYDPETGKFDDEAGP